MEGSHFCLGQGVTILCNYPEPFYLQHSLKAPSWRRLPAEDICSKKKNTFPHFTSRLVILIGVFTYHHCCLSVCSQIWNAPQIEESLEQSLAALTAKHLLTQTAFRMCSTPPSFTATHSKRTGKQFLWHLHLVLIAREPFGCMGGIHTFALGIKGVLGSMLTSSGRQTLVGKCGFPLLLDSVNTLLVLDRS